jgi:hypothetical protein
VDVFCSYARVDLAFARQVVDGLRAAGRTVWVDLEGLYAGEQWWDSIRTAIDASDAFVFIVSPASAASRQCRAEVEHASAQGKRILPVLHRAIDDEPLPHAIASTQWLLDFAAGGDTGAAALALVRVLDTDAAWVRAHTRWLQRSVEWDRAGRPRDLLMPAGAIEEAERWLTPAVEREPRITDLQRSYVAASRRSALFDSARSFAARGGPDIEALDAAVRAARDAAATALDAPETATLFACTSRVRRAFPLRAHERFVSHIDITPDGARALTGGGDDFAVLWDIAAEPALLIGRLTGAYTFFAQIHQLWQKLGGNDPGLPGTLPKPIIYKKVSFFR